MGVGSRGARGAVTPPPLDFLFNRKFGEQVWSEIKAKVLELFVFVWVIAVAPLTQIIFLRQCKGPFQY